MPRPVRFGLASAGIALVAAIALHAYDCQVGTQEACRMSEGMFSFYFVGVFVFSWVVLACFGAFFDALKPPPRAK
jgi:hypothetical protein